MPFEVNGFSTLQAVHKNFKKNKVRVGDSENRGHSGRNFVFYVWMEISLMCGVSEDCVLMKIPGWKIRK